MQKGKRLMAMIMQADEEPEESEPASAESDAADDDGGEDEPPAARKRTSGEDRVMPSRTSLGRLWSWAVGAQSD